MDYKLTKEQICEVINLIPEELLDEVAIDLNEQKISLYPIWDYDWQHDDCKSWLVEIDYKKYNGFFTSFKEEVKRFIASKKEKI